MNRYRPPTRCKSLRDVGPALARKSVAAAIEMAPITAAGQRAAIFGGSYSVRVPPTFGTVNGALY